jgi:predicted transcriptional regulator
MKGEQWMEFKKHVKIRQEKFGAVVFDTLCEKVFVTNETGAEIIRLLGEKKEPPDVIAELAKNYGDDPATISEDIEEFILRLRDYGIIKRRGKSDRKRIASTLK